MLKEKRGEQKHRGSLDPTKTNLPENLTWWVVSIQPSWKDSSKWVHLPQVGMNIEKYLKPPPSHCFLKVDAETLFWFVVRLTWTDFFCWEIKNWNRQVSIIKLVNKTIRIYCVGVSKNRGTPKWMVKIMENPIKSGWFGGNPTIFGNTHIYIYIS